VRTGNKSENEAEIETGVETENEYMRTGVRLVGRLGSSIWDWD
jgi:hypothetical protein